MSPAMSGRAAALMPECSKGPRMGKVRLSQLKPSAAAKHSLPHPSSPGKQGHEGNEGVHGDKGGSGTLHVPPMFKDSLLKALETCTDISVVQIVLNSTCERLQAWPV